MADKDQEKKVNNNTNNSATNNDYEVAQESYSFWGAVWRRFRRHKLAIVGLWILVFVFIFSFIGPVFYTLDPAENIFEEDVANFYMYKIN
ncbi:MAG TPA: ABC transporter permease, partial [Coprothermobacter proteolyticus]|nr:ABC transporter permease [Coprothermobacter proteolyticus]